MKVSVLVHRFDRPRKRVVGFVDKRTDHLAVTAQLNGSHFYMVTHRATGWCIGLYNCMNRETALKLKRQIEPLANWSKLAPALIAAYEEKNKP